MWQIYGLNFSNILETSVFTFKAINASTEICWFCLKFMKKLHSSSNPFNHMLQGKIDHRLLRHPLKCSFKHHLLLKVEKNKQYDDVCEGSETGQSSKEHAGNEAFSS